MKTYMVKILLIAGLMIASLSLFSQGSTPPPPPTDPGIGNQPVGGGAPIGAGAGMLLLMAAGYGAKKVYDARQKLAE